MFNTILVAIDGSGHSSRAAGVAIDLAARYGAHLVVAHAVTTGPVPEALAHMATVEHLVDEAPTDELLDVPGLVGLRPEHRVEQLEQLHRAIAAHLIGRTARDARDAGIENVSTEVLEEDPVTGILASIDRHGADLVVLGSRGLSDLKGLLLGSVSHKICQLSPCTCVTVK